MKKCPDRAFFHFGQVPQGGIELPTKALGEPCSVLLSYWGSNADYIMDARLRRALEIRTRLLYEPKRPR